jgi:hypothetical protein
MRFAAFTSSLVNVYRYQVVAESISPHIVYVLLPELQLGG